MFLSPDLLFSSRVQAGALQQGRTFRAASLTSLKSAEQQPECRLVFIDLASLGAVSAESLAPVRAACPNAKLIAFGPHVDDATLVAARDAGCDEVQTRGQFHREFPELIRAAFA